MAETRTKGRIAVPTADLQPLGSFFWFVAFLVRARRQLIVIPILVAVITYGGSWLLPNWYASTASFVPPRETGLAAGIGSLSSILQNPSLRGLSNLAGGRNAMGNYLSILESRSAKEAVVRRFGLMQVYEIENQSMESAVKALDANVEINVAEEGHITVTVFDKDPQRAAEMANFYLTVVNDISTDLSLQAARKYREFLENGVIRTQDSLRVYEETFRDFQKKENFVIIPENVQSGIKSVADLYAQKTLLELEVEFLRQTVGKENSTLKQKQLELNLLSQRVAEIPDLGLEHLRLFRAITIQTKILEVLIPLLEQARLEERRETPSVAVLDAAVPAEKKAKPRRSTIAAVAGLSSLILTVLSYAIWERMKYIQIQSPERYELLRALFRFRNNR
ncbi:MAG: hypothetical protein MN733_13735 [Nitrososphaera sp.]|nr:hypothetical protein [Nitrososphaera sp.]MCI0708310.1 hypothetical protein [Ignavibacteriota bacterium]